jgi:hypothetical protein
MEATARSVIDDPFPRRPLAQVAPPISPAGLSATGCSCPSRSLATRKPAGSDSPLPLRLGQCGDGIDHRHAQVQDQL